MFASTQVIERQYPCCILKKFFAPTGTVEETLNLIKDNTSLRNYEQMELLLNK